MGLGGPQAGRRDMGRNIYGHVLWDGTGGCLWLAWAAHPEHREIERDLGRWVLTVDELWIKSVGS